MAHHGTTNNPGRNRPISEGDDSHLLHSGKRTKTNDAGSTHQQLISTLSTTTNGTTPSITPSLMEGSPAIGIRDGHFVIVPQEPQGDIDMEQEVESGREETESEPDLQEELDEENIFMISGVKDRSLVMRARMDQLPEDNWPAKKKGLQDLLIALGVSTITLLKKKMHAEGDYVEFAVQTQQEVELLMALSQEGTEVPKLFFQPNPAARESINARTIEVYGLSPRTPKELIRTSLAKFGAVSGISLRACTRGIKCIAEVIFQSTDSVAKVKASNAQAVFIGQDMARLKSLGGESVTWVTDHVRKLSGLRFGTTPLDLGELLAKEEGKADFIDIPRIFNKDGSKMRRQQEAFIYFSSKEEMEKATHNKCFFGNKTLEWCDVNAKRCYQCGSAEHTRRGCEEHKKIMEKRDNVRMVTEFSRGGSLKVVPGSTFSRMSGKSYASTVTPQAPFPQMQRVPPPQQERQQQQQQQQQQHHVEHISTPSQELIRLRALEKAQNNKIHDLQSQLASITTIMEKMEQRLNMMATLLDNMGKKMGFTDFATTSIVAEVKGAIANRAGSGDFNGVMDPRADRLPQRGGAQPETELLQWLQTQALYDAFRSIHPLARGYSFGTTSRIDMVFVSQTLAHRFIQCTHDSLEGIADSDHQMVNVSLTLHGSQHLTRQSHQKYAKPTGFRFLFREAGMEEFGEFCKNLTQQLEKSKDELKAIGLQTFSDKVDEEEQDQFDNEQLRGINLEQG
ncbi:hypothetical protein BG005_011552, partial [Podila minutissima]